MQFKIATLAAVALIAASPLALAAGYGQSSATKSQQTLQSTTGTSGQMKKSSAKSKKPVRHATRKRHHRIARGTPKHATTGMATAKPKRMMRETTGSASSQPASKKKLQMQPTSKKKLETK